MQAVMIELELKLIRWEKLKINLRNNSKKEGIPCVTNIVLALYGFFMSSNNILTLMINQYIESKISSQTEYNKLITITTVLCVHIAINFL